MGLVKKVLVLVGVGLHRHLSLQLDTKEFEKAHAMLKKFLGRVSAGRTMVQQLAYHSHSSHKRARPEAPARPEGVSVKVPKQASSVAVQWDELDQPMRLEYWMTSKRQCTDFPSEVVWWP